MTDAIKSFCYALDLWFDIEAFLKVARVGSDYQTTIDKFVDNLSKFYNCGGITFLTKKETGDDETFYLHSLRYYLPKIAQDTWTKHSVGIGMFTMQGYERRNKESKSVLQKFNNNKGNIVVANMK